MITEVRSDSQLLRFVAREDDPGTVYVYFWDEEEPKSFVSLTVTELAKMVRTILASQQ